MPSRSLIRSMNNNNFQTSENLLGISQQGYESYWINLIFCRAVLPSLCRLVPFGKRNIVECLKRQPLCKAWPIIVECLRRQLLYEVRLVQVVQRSGASELLGSRLLKVQKYSGHLEVIPLIIVGEFLNNIPCI